MADLFRTTRILLLALCPKIGGQFNPYELLVMSLRVGWGYLCFRAKSKVDFAANLKSKAY
jgi:hypothetical protein